MAQVSYPVVRFQTRDGRTVETELENKIPEGVDVGQEVAVLYDPLHPKVARLAAEPLPSFIRPTTVFDTCLPSCAGCSCMGFIFVLTPLLLAIEGGITIAFFAWVVGVAMVVGPLIINYYRTREFAERLLPGTGVVTRIETKEVYSGPTLF